MFVVNKDGLHGAIEKSGTIGLQAGKHAISLGYLQQWGGSVLIANYEGPGISKQVIPASALYRVSINGLPPAVNLASSLYIVSIPGATTALSLGEITPGINPIITSSMQVGIKAYPNPFTNSILINITGNAGDYKIMLVDISGKIIWTGSGIKNSGAFQQRVNTSSIQRGVYFLKVVQNNKVSVIKLEK